MKFHFKGIHIVSNKITKLFSGGRGSAVSIFPFVFYKNKYIRMNRTTMLHEKIHLQQQLECGLAGLLIFGVQAFIMDQVLWLLPAILFYYVFYFILYLINLIKYKDKYEAYKNIAFEREAFKNENQKYYLVFRKHFSWIKEL